MPINKENSDFIVDMVCVSNVLKEYHSILKEITNRLEIIDARSRLLPPQYWSGEGRVSFNQSLNRWIKEVQNTQEELCGTESSLKYLLEEAKALRQKAEQFKVTVE